MSTLSTRVVKVITFLTSERSTLLADLALAKEALAAALANDAADAASIAAAQADATAARAEAESASARVGELQALADEDLAEDAEIGAALDTVELPAEPPAEEPPVA